MVLLATPSLGAAGVISKINQGSTAGPVLKGKVTRERNRDRQRKEHAATAPEAQRDEVECGPSGSAPRPIFSRRVSVSEQAGKLKQPRQRLPMRKRREAEQRVQQYQMQRWLLKHSLIAVPRIELSSQRKAALHECFSLLDADSGGTINFSELSIAMKALGFTAAAIKEALALGDVDGDGELNFEEFCALISRAGTGGGSSSAAGAQGDSFPFALIANSYRISKLVSSYDPALKPDDLSGARRLPPIGNGAAHAHRAAHAARKGGPAAKTDNWRLPKITAS